MTIVSGWMSASRQGGRFVSASLRFLARRFGTDGEVVLIMGLPGAGKSRTLELWLKAVTRG